MTIDLEQCGKRFSALPFEDRSRWIYNGTLIGIKPNNKTQITRQGCLELCGTGIDFYDWEDISATITTWILPVVGTLIQAPFESNQTRKTFLAITRWVGSPIASISYVLWNIKVAAKAALMVDMSVMYELRPGIDSDFGSMRDSMYLLLVMNQYTLHRTAYMRTKEAEGLLRIALFSRDLNLLRTKETLRERRRTLAREVRQTRRRGAVPAFVSTMWFLFAFALSIEDAFSDLGANSTAHYLALGCLLAWFPILIMGSIVDRNPIAADATREKLNKLVEDVRLALQNEQKREQLINTFSRHPNFARYRDRIISTAIRSSGLNNFDGSDTFDFFTEFAGQGRLRWHYGAAHSILSDIENCYIAEKGRNWLEDEEDARLNLVLGTVNDEGLVWVDKRQFWQIFSSFLIVLGSCASAFVLSFFTPTVGLGCRSGGYMVFFVVALVLLIMEMAVWRLLSPEEVFPDVSLSLHRESTITMLQESASNVWKTFKKQVSGMFLVSERWVNWAILNIVLFYPWQDKTRVSETVGTALDSFGDGVRRLKRHVETMTAQERWELFFFRPVELFNTGWLLYIVSAQVIGWYVTCDCVTSIWGFGGGYLDFQWQDKAPKDYVLWYWITGTILASLILALSMFYITVEWCQQSWMSTDDYAEAMKGLRLTRIYRYWTFALRRFSRYFWSLVLAPFSRYLLQKKVIREQKTLMWTKTLKFPTSPKLRQTSAPDTIELQETLTSPQQHSQLPSATAPVPFQYSFSPDPMEDSRQPRASSQSHRVSFDSHDPLLQSPDRAHIDNFRRSSGEGYPSPSARLRSDGHSSSEGHISPGRRPSSETHGDLGAGPSGGPYHYPRRLSSSAGSPYLQVSSYEDDSDVLPSSHWTSLSPQAIAAPYPRQGFQRTNSDTGPQPDVPDLLGIPPNPGAP